MPYPRFKISMPRREILLFWRDALEGGGGDPVGKFTEAFREFGGFQEVLPVASGRSGFRLLLESLDFPEGSEIIFPAYTFHPMPVTAAECGLTPVFADVDRKTWNIDPESLRSAITGRTRAVVPTHLFGAPAEMEAINAIARERDLFVIEDCAHALGAAYRGRPVGTWGDAGLFTFAMSKNLPCWGGGAVTLADRGHADRMRDRLKGEKPPPPVAVLRRQFSNILAMIFTGRGLFPWTLYPALRLADILKSDYFDRPFLEEVRPPHAPPVNSPDKKQSGSKTSPDDIGIRSDKRPPVLPMAPLQAAVGLRQLKRFPGWLEKQIENARLLRSRLSGCPGLRIQQEPPEGRSSFLYVRARVDDPLAFRRKLLRTGLDTKPDDMRNCAALGFFERRAPCPAAEELSGRCIEIPSSHFLPEREINEIADRIRSVLKTLE